MPASGSQASSMAFTAPEPARLPLFPASTGESQRRFMGFTDVTDRLVASTPLRTRPLDHARGLRYRGPGRLPGPDSHRQAVLPLRLSYTITTSSSIWRPSLWAHSGVLSWMGADPKLAATRPGEQVAAHG